MLGAPRAAFVPSGPFVVVARNFVYAGRNYAKGEPFTGTSDRHELFALWNGLKLDMAPAAKPDIVQSAAAQPQPEPSRPDRKHKRRW